MDRFLEVARRDLGDVRILAADDPDLEGAPLQRELPDGRFLVVVPDSETRDLETLAGRLELLLECFRETLESLAPVELPRSRPSPPDALCQELRGLAQRTSAADVFVIDIDSPVVWCSAVAGPATDATGRPLTRGARIAASRMTPTQLKIVDETWPDEEEKGWWDPRLCGDDELPTIPEITRAAIERLRDLSGLEALRRGKRLRHVLRSPQLGLITRSMADIYLLAMVFEGDFVELVAERALTGVLPRVERLIQALPPLDPTPRGGSKVKAIPIRRGGA